MLSIDFSTILMWDINTWPIEFCILYIIIIILGLEFLSRFIPWLFDYANKIPIKGKHLDKFSLLDNSFIIVNKLFTCCFVYHVCQVVYYTDSIKLKHEELTIYNTVGSLFLFYVVYDFFYMNFHRILHFRSLYEYIHKHHHRQKAPSRGNLDAINVHPFEFVIGEYLHLFTIYMIPCHIYTVIFFILVGGILASLNHTRLDINIPYFFSVKLHDVHHRLPESNYGQYTYYWDILFGSYRPYDFKI
jgi:sterol desaturase/sphingolipid hydroxylase (fatty acid hydroxylase superfamily)